MWNVWWKVNALNCFVWCWAQGGRDAGVDVWNVPWLGRGEKLLQVNFLQTGLDTVGLGYLELCCARWSRGDWREYVFRVVCPPSLVVYVCFQVAPCWTYFVQWRRGGADSGAEATGWGQWTVSWWRKSNEGLGVYWESKLQMSSPLIVLQPIGSIWDNLRDCRYALMKVAFSGCSSRLRHWRAWVVLKRGILTRILMKRALST